MLRNEPPLSDGNAFELNAEPRCRSGEGSPFIFAFVLAHKNYSISY